LDQFAIPVGVQGSMAPIFGVALLGIALGRVYMMRRANPHQSPDP